MDLQNFPDDLITPRAAAKLLKCHLATIHRWIQTGKLPAWKRAGERYLVSKANVLQLVQPVAGPVTRTPTPMDEWAKDVLAQVESGEWIRRLRKEAKEREAAAERG